MRIALTLILTALPGLACALMPPHWNSIEPAPGSTLQGRILVVKGFTLANAELKITDGDGKSVPFSTEVDCAWEGEGDMPGARQQRCTLRAKLMGELKKGTQITVALFRNTAEYTIGDVDGAPAAPASDAPASDAPAAPKSAAPASE